MIHGLARDAERVAAEIARRTASAERGGAAVEAAVN
jgi:hypothetical protein